MVENNELEKQYMVLRCEGGGCSRIPEERVGRK